MNPDLDPVIHTPKRLAAMAVLSGATEATFRYLREHLELADPDLSRHMSALESAGYVQVHKDGRGRGASTTFRLTATGRAAFLSHRAALHALLDGQMRSDPPPG